ncbi:hypothetical protein [Arthrobacter sp. NPDC090010]|uniref:hypothetical protein n=1 Tax=Arthrobacter sp. NPDC090010 TaxID=3363942 RepID=UPI0038115AC0
MRVKSAIAVFVLGLVALLVGIGQKTIWAPPDRLSVALPDSVKAAPVTVLDPSFERLGGGQVQLKVKGEGSFVVATGRPDDVTAWTGKAASNTVSGLSEDGKSLAVKHNDGDATVPNPADADIWASTQSGSGELSFSWEPPASGDWSMVIASDGTKAAPAQLEVSYANNATTPWAVPLMVIGGVLMLGALLFAFLFGKPGNPKKPVSKDTGDESAEKDEPEKGDGTAEDTKTEETKADGEHAEAGDSTADTAGDQKTSTDAADESVPAESSEPKDEEKPSLFRRIPALAGALALAVTGVGLAPAQADSSPSPSASADAQSRPYPVMTDQQLQRILGKTADVVSSADAAKNAKDLGARAAGEALTIRTQNYKIRAAVGSYAPVAPVSTDKLLTSVVPLESAWPRTIMAVTQSSKNPTPLVLTLQQASARENYKLISSSYLLPGNSFPATDADGLQALDPKTSDGLLSSPSDGLTALMARLKDPKSAAAAKFGDNTYFQQMDAFKKSVVDPKNNGAKITPKFDFKLVGKPDAAFRSSDGGAVVVADLELTVSLVSPEKGGIVDLDAQSAALAGTKKTDKSVTQHFIESVALRIPPAGSKDGYTLLSADSHLTAVTLG